METVWMETPHHIKYALEEKIVRIQADQDLKDFLAEKGNGSETLAAYLCDAYRRKFGKELEIGQHSLAVEILGHAYLDVLLEAISVHLTDTPISLEPVLEALKKIEAHTDVIDCGEKEVDSNRWIWDFLAPFHKILYRAIQDYA